MKKYMLMVCLLSSLFLIINVIRDYNNVEKDLNTLEKEETDALKFKEEYESLNEKKSSSGRVYPSIEIDENNQIKYSTVSEIKEVVDSGTGIIYLGYPACPWCRNAVPVLLHAASDAGVDNIYYIDMSNERDKYVVEDGELVLEEEGTEEYQTLLDIFDEYLDDYIIEVDGKEYDTLEKRIYVPIVFFVKEGDIVGVHMDTVKSQKNPYEFLDDEQYEELYNIYSGYIHDMLGDLCDERC